MGRVAGVFDNPPGFPCTPPGVDVLEGGKLTSNNVAGSSHNPLQSPVVASGAVSKMKFRNKVYKLGSGGAHQILSLINTGGTQSR